MSHSAMSVGVHIEAVSESISNLAADLEAKAFVQSKVQEILAGLRERGYTLPEVSTTVDSDFGYLKAGFTHSGSDN